MFKRSYNRAVLRLRIGTVTPLLIRAGDAGLDPTAADLTCVRTRHARHGLTAYIPGTSLKGVLRAAAEASVRGQKLRDGLVGACEDPLSREERKSCSGALSSKEKRELPSSERHKAHCLACRLFGSLAMKGRASVRDLLPWSIGGDDRAAPDGENRRLANHLELRHNVAIDRITGAARNGALFEQELVPAGVSFWGEIALENYQVWQLGLLAQAFQEMNDGIAQLGSSKSRGLGVATVDVESILHEQAGLDEGHPKGVWELADDDARRAYGLLREPSLPVSSGVPHGLCTRFSVDSKADLNAWLDTGLCALGGLR